MSPFADTYKRKASELVKQDDHLTTCVAQRCEFPKTAGLVIYLFSAGSLIDCSYRERLLCYSGAILSAACATGGHAR